MNQEYPPEPLEPAPVDAPPAPAERQGVPIPLHKARATTVLLVAIGVIFGLQFITESINLRPSVVAYGAQINALVAMGQYWRLLTAMFLHFGIAHFVFNAWALLSLGQEVEALYDTSRFLLLYFLGGLLGGVASYLLAPADWLLVPSAGASGAIFAIVGANGAFFLANHRTMGSLGRQRLANLAILIVINLAIGFTPGSGINNYAHLGGLAGGFVLGLGLTPRYALGWGMGFAPQLVDRTTASLRALAVVGVIVLLLAGVYLGNQRWLPYLPTLQ